MMLEPPMNELLDQVPSRYMLEIGRASCRERV